MNTDATKVSPNHLDRDAYLYVRQSTLRQVVENTESTLGIPPVTPDAFKGYEEEIFKFKVSTSGSQLPRRPLQRPAGHLCVRDRTSKDSRLQ